MSTNSVNRIIKFTILLIGEGRRLLVIAPSKTESIIYMIFCLLLALIFRIYINKYITIIVSNIEHIINIIFTNPSFGVLSAVHILLKISIFVHSLQ